MTDSCLLRTLALSTSLVATACVAESDTTGDLTRVGDATVVHMQPFRAAGKTADVAPPGAHLTYFGGPLLTSIHVAPLYWNAGVNGTDGIDFLYMFVPASSFFDLFAQYGIGHGNGQAGFVDNRANVANLTDAQIQAEVLNQINLGHLPPPTNPNNYYPVHFPPNVNITAPDGSRSCVQFCAYHGTFQVQNGAGTIFTIAYGVVPYVGNPGCAGGCGGNAQVINNETSVASHELVEAATDPDVGIAPGIGFPLGWYDPTNGEIGDICNGQQTTIVANGHTYVVQKEFSNAANACVP
jgi:hypothetical protein